jgi:16S rRNA (adenine1518-N6/adenine1519-N6)-dimethyltransferase
MSLNLTSRKAIKALANQYGAHPSKGLGQNFLIDKSVLKKIIKAANLTKKDVILEIGPGIGNLTRGLSHKAKRVIAVEKDPKMIQILKETMKDYNNVEIISGDILKIPDTKYNIQHTRYKVVANLPFYIAAPVIRKFLESCKVQPCTMTLMVQKEVAQRICAKPPKMNLLAVSVQFYAKPEIISCVSKKSFWPQPKVDSAILKITPSGKKSTIVAILPEKFFRVVKAGFSQPRKMLINNLVKKLKMEKEKIEKILQKNSISSSQRPETLTVKDWVNVTQEFSTLSLL